MARRQLDVGAIFFKINTAIEIKNNNRARIFRKSEIFNWEFNIFFNFDIRGHKNVQNFKLHFERNFPYFFKLKKL